ncbi:MAG: ribose-phosphate pyrophosphokinase [Erysipelotrichaceae bacterium]|nr:ribose-phosphate pyrophosphokinase [Erysipelotrichaceae bacterium]
MNKEDTMIFGLTANTELVNEICGYLNIVPGEIAVRHFADGEIIVEPGETVRGKNIFLIQSTCRPVTEHLMEVLVALDALKRASAADITCVMPYYGYARQDRKAKPRQPITAKLVANLLEAAGADRVIMFDLHAAQIQGFFNCPTDNLTAIPLMGTYFQKELNIDAENTVVVSPDHGGTTRARYLGEMLGCPIAIIDKRRPRPNAVEVNNVIGEVEGKNCIVVDDICDTGGSLVAGCELLKKYGAKDIYAAVTHPIFSGDAAHKIQNSCIKEIVVTNTIPLEDSFLEVCDKARVLSIGRYLASIIEAISSHRPVSGVYTEVGKQLVVKGLE